MPIKKCKSCENSLQKSAKILVTPYKKVYKKIYITIINQVD